MFEITMAIIIFFLGASLASFYIAQIYRIEKELPLKEFITKGSYCEGCGKELCWYELIPVISYFFQRGKCHKCGFKISFTYPLFEFVNGITLAILYLRQVPIDYYLFSQFLFFLAVYDFYYKGFPKSIMHTFLIVALLFSAYKFIFQYNFSLLVIFVAVAISLSVLILNLIKRSFGFGDLLVVLMLGLVLTLKELIAVIFFSILIAGIYAIVLLIMKKVNKKDSIPFVPFIHVAFILIFAIEPIVDKYFTYLIYLW